MEWPSKQVSQGGIFHPPKVNFSQDTKQFINTLMEEALLTIKQRDKVNYYLRNGYPLTNKSPKQCKRVSKSVPKNNYHTSRRRTLESILDSNAYERERFVPLHPRVDRDKEKEKLQNLFAYGDTMEPLGYNGKPKPRKPTVEMNRFDELVQEIEERREFLNKMKRLGEEKKYKNIIEQEICARIREMEALKIEDTPR